MEKNFRQSKVRRLNAPSSSARAMTVPDARVKPPMEKRPFPVNGQGTLIFNTDRKGLPFYACVEEEGDEVNGDIWLGLQVRKDFAAFLQKGKGKMGPVELVRITMEGCGLEEGHVSYWYSYDRNNLVLKYGKGYRMEETTLMEFDFLKGVEGEEAQMKVREELYPYFNAEKPKYVTVYNEISTSRGGLEVSEPLIEFDSKPLVFNVPPLVMDSSKLTLFDLDRGDYVFSASLPSACKEMYSNVKGCVLNYTEDASEEILLSDAIRYSLANGMLKAKLEEKRGELSDSPEGTYLRVTCGRAEGKSPGIPYVLEIWPVGHFSPVHNHGNAEAVIKVLYGGLSIDIYNKQSNMREGMAEPTPISHLEIKKDDVVWLDRNWYQTHKLYNNGADYCATIQCYTYSASDTTFWPYFDFINDDEDIDEFFPSSDYGFIDFRTQVMAEYKASLGLN